MTQHISRTGTILLIGAGLLSAPVGTAIAGQPDVNPGLQQLLVLESRNEKSDGFVIEVDTDYTGNRRIDRYQSNIQRNAIREKRNNRRNIFQRFFDRNRRN
jgi:hypothetical protein